MSVPTPFEPGASLARIVGRDGGFAVYTHAHRVAHVYMFRCPGETAEFAAALRDEGGWPLRFGPGTAAVEQFVNELDEEGAP